MTAGEKRHNTTIKGICLSSQSPSSHLITTKQEEEVCSGTSGENSVAKRRAQVFSPVTLLKCDKSVLSFKKKSMEEQSHPQEATLPDCVVIQPLHSGHTIRALFLWLWNCQRQWASRITLLIYKMNINTLVRHLLIVHFFMFSVSLWKNILYLGFYSPQPLLQVNHRPLHVLCSHLTRREGDHNKLDT